MSEQQRAVRAEKALVELTPGDIDDKASVIGKLKDKSTNFYEHVEELRRFLRRFDMTDVPSLVARP